MNYFIQSQVYRRVNDIHSGCKHGLSKLDIRFMTVIHKFQEHGKNDLLVHKQKSPTKSAKLSKRSQTLYQIQSYIRTFLPEYYDRSENLVSYISCRDIYGYGHPLLVTLYISRLDKSLRNKAIYKYLHRINIVHCIYICKQLTEETLSLLIYEFLESRRKKYIQYGNSSRTIYNLMIIRDDEYREANIRQYATFDTIVDFIVKYQTCSKEFILAHKSFVTNHKLINNISDKLSDELFDNVD